MDPMWSIPQSLIIHLAGVAMLIPDGKYSLVSRGQQRTLKTLVGLQQIYIHNRRWTLCDTFLKVLSSIWLVLQCWFLRRNLPWGQQRTLKTLIGLQQIYIHPRWWTPCDPFLKALSPFGQCCNADSWLEIFLGVYRELWTHWLVCNKYIFTIQDGPHVTHFSKPIIHLASVAMLILDGKYSMGSTENPEHICWFAITLYPP